MEPLFMNLKILLPHKVFAEKKKVTTDCDADL